MKELELSKCREKSSDLNVKIDLLIKLKTILDENKRQLNYLEEDFINLKNQRDKIKQTIDDYKSQIQDLEKRKKESISQINKITSETYDSSQNFKMNNSEIKESDQRNLSKSEKIRALQKQAKDYQYEIKQINLKLEETRFKFNQINPNYDKLKNDYLSLIDIIKTNKNREKAVKSDLEEKLKANDSIKIEGLDFKKIDWIKPSRKIINEIQIVEQSMNKIVESNNLKITQQSFDLSRFLNKSKELDEIIKNNKNEITISTDQNEIVESIKNLRILEVLINNLQILLNKFLTQINLECQLNLFISEDNKNFSLKLIFDPFKEKVKFESLTTPEKIFFVIALDLSIKTLLKKQNIIFSNLFIPKIYNKRGSIYRTIRKILPVFEIEDTLKNINLIFIISNLEMKKPIENIKIINIIGTDNQND